MPSSRFKMHLLDYLVYSIISILCSRENNFNLLHLARIEENSITLFFSTDSSSSITIIEINSSTVLDYLVFASSFIYVKANVEGMILICKEKLLLFHVSSFSALEFLPISKSQLGHDMQEISFALDLLLLICRICFGLFHLDLKLYFLF